MIETHFTQPLLSWYDCHGRKNLPWQQPRSPYYVWLSEIMLQQTQVKTVIPYFHRFISHFPTLEHLANAHLDAVLALWSGLGYYSRARNLHRCAQLIQSDFNGIFPQDLVTLIGLPGIGESTAAAICSLAFNQATAILDGNVKRVLCRFFAIDKVPDKAPVKRTLWQLAQACMDTTRCADYTQAIMDLGATCCTRAKPRCEICPLKPHCQAYAQNKVLDLPLRPPKKKKPSRDGFFLIIRNPLNQIWLQKNQAKGIWSGLWCFPYFETLEESHQWLEKEWGINHKKKIPDTLIKHTFTHFHLQLHAYQYQYPHPHIHGIDEANEQWLSATQLASTGLPKPITVLLKQIWQLPT